MVWGPWLRVSEKSTMIIVTSPLIDPMKVQVFNQSVTFDLS